MPAKADSKSAMLFRTAAIDRAALNAESREIPLSFASEQPVERWDWETGGIYLEVLDCASEKSADFARLNAGGALLREHDRRSQVGVVVPGSAKIEADKKARCLVRLSRSPLGEAEFQDIKDGIRTLVSVGYHVGRELAREKNPEGVETRRFEWTPYEVSIVSIPADTSVGVGRERPSVDEPPLPDVERIAEKLNPEQRMKLSTLLRAPAETPVTPPALD